MTSKYKSSKSVAKNQTVPINAGDPRLSALKIGATKARQGAEIDIIGLDGKSLIQGGSSPGNVSGATRPADDSPKTVVYSTSPANNEPPKYYPGGSGPFVITPTSPTDVTATWSGENLVVSFNWDYENEYNATVSQFVLEITADGVTRRTPTNTFIPNKTQTAQTLTLTKALNRVTFGLFRTGITSICVLAADPLNNISSTTCAATVPTYVLDLPTPVITVASISNGYSVAYTTPTQSSYDAIDIWEIESTSTTAPTITYVTGTSTPSNYSRSYFSNLNPANVITQNYNKRWVIARFSSSGGTFTPFCVAQVVTPTSPVSVDNTPPNEVTQITTSWSGDNIIVNYKLPSQNAGSRVQIELTAPNSLVGFFYRFPDGSGRDQTTTITKRDLLEQFGEHYSSFSGILRSIDTADNRSAGVSFTVAARVNPLLGITPTFTLTPLTNGYSVFATNYATSVGVNYMEVYAKHTPWVGDPTNDDYVVYAGSNPAVIIDEDYTTVYVKIRYYDDFNNSSSYSIENTVIPLGPGEITSFETPITFGTNGVIYAGGDHQSGSRTVFKTSGLFAYDSTSTSPTTGITTQIVSNASAGTPTFITTRAQIADWNITDTKIENDLSGAPTKYTGLSATGTYSFWAGSDVSGGNSSADFTVTPAGAVTARNITIIGNGSPLSNLISAGGLFTVKNDGTVSATGANISGSLNVTGASTFTGNVKIDTGGSLYALGAGGTVSSGIRTIFNSSGVAAYNSSGGYAQMLTTPLADGSVFATTAATIGGWEVDASKIQKTSISGKGNIILDSTNGYIAVSNSSIASSLAGINSPGNNLTHSVFWAGGTNPNDESNSFRVTLGGTLFAKGAVITGGSISSIGALGNVTIDGTKSLISLASDSKTSYLIPRNGNIYLTAPGTGTPWGSTDGNPGTTGKITAAPTAEPYFAAGASFNDPWGNTTAGVGIYTGKWDYFSSPYDSDPFITVAKSGTIQLSASPSIGMIIEQGGAVNDAFSEPTMLIYTANNSASPTPSYSPSTEYGAWATFQEDIIKFSASNNTFIHINGSTGNRVITLQASPNSDDTDSPYIASSKIVLSEDKVQIFGLTAQGDSDIIKREQSSGIHSGYRLGKNGEDLYPLGAYGRQRMVVQNEYTGELLRGMAVYYSSTNEFSTTAPTSSTGVVGDLFVVY